MVPSSVFPVCITHNKYLLIINSNIKICKSTILLYAIRQSTTTPRLPPCNAFYHNSPSSSLDRDRQDNLRRTTALLSRIVPSCGHRWRFLAAKIIWFVKSWFANNMVAMNKLIWMYLMYPMFKTTGKQYLFKTLFYYIWECV